MIGLAVTQLVASVTGQDSRGNDISTWAPLQVQALAFVPGQTAENIQATDQVTADAELYLPSGVTVAPEDRFQFGNGEVYEVNGHSSAWSSPFTGVDGAVMVRLRRVTGAAAHTVAG